MTDAEIAERQRVLDEASRDFPAPEREPEKRDRVLVESPYGTNEDGTRADPATRALNVRYLLACMYDCFMRGEAPFASHGLYPLLLDDGRPEHRTMGMEAGWRWGDAAERSVVYLDRGFTPGVAGGVLRACTEARSVVFRTLHPNVLAACNIVRLSGTEGRVALARSLGFMVEEAIEYDVTGPLKYIAPVAPAEVDASTEEPAGPRKKRW